MDLSNQIRHSERYLTSLKEAGQQPGRHLSIRAGEWFSGLPAGWTSAERNAVDMQVFTKMFPKAMEKASLIASISFGVRPTRCRSSPCSLGVGRLNSPSVGSEK